MNKPILYKLLARLDPVQLAWLYRHFTDEQPAQHILRTMVAYETTREAACHDLFIQIIGPEAWPNETIAYAVNDQERLAALRAGLSVQEVDYLITAVILSYLMTQDAIEADVRNQLAFLAKAGRPHFRTHFIAFAPAGTEARAKDLFPELF